MPYDWNLDKCAANIAKHGVSFEAVEGFEWETALVRADTRADYGEVRLNGLGVIGDRLHMLTYTPRRNVTWIISLRRASRKEERFYASEV